MFTVDREKVKFEGSSKSDLYDLKELEDTTL